MTYLLTHERTCDVAVCRVYGLSTAYLIGVPDNLAALVLWDYVCSQGGYLVAWNVDDEMFQQQEDFRTEYYAYQGLFGVGSFPLLMTQQPSQLDEHDLATILRGASWMLTWSEEKQVDLAGDLRPKGVQRGMAAAKDCTCEVLPILCQANDLLILPGDFYMSPLDYYFKAVSVEIMQQSIELTWSAIINHPTARNNLLEFVWNEDLMAYVSRNTT